MGKPSAIEKEEMLAPYDPILPIDSKRVLSHKYHVRVVFYSRILFPS